MLIYFHGNCAFSLPDLMTYGASLWDTIRLLHLPLQLDYSHSAANRNRWSWSSRDRFFPALFDSDIDLERTIPKHSLRCRCLRRNCISGALGPVDIWWKDVTFQLVIKKRLSGEGFLISTSWADFEVKCQQSLEYVLPPPQSTAPRDGPIRVHFQWQNFELVPKQALIISRCITSSTVSVNSNTTCLISHNSSRFRRQDKVFSNLKMILKWAER